MNHADHRLPWSPEEHPPLALLREYQAGVLTPATEHHLERHLLSCELCADLAEGLTMSTPAQTQAAVKDIQTRVGKMLAKEKKKAPVWADWRAAAAILVLLCSMGLVIYQQYSQQINNTSTIAVAPEKPSSNQETSEVTKDQPLAGKHLDEEIVVNEGTFKPSAPPVVQQRKKGKQLEEVVLPDIEAKTWLLQKEITAQDKNSDPLPITSSPVMSVDTIQLSDAIARRSSFESYVPPAESLEMKLAKQKEPAVSTALAGRVAGVTVSSPKRLVKGKVVSPDGEALPGVTVQLRGTSQAAATDVNGEFQLQVPRGQAMLVANFIGYEQEVVVLAQNTQDLEIKLKEDQSSLSEVVVVGYGTSSKASPPPTDVKIPARPEIGFKRYRRYLQQNIKHPESTDGKKITGRVSVQFTVSASGQIENLQILKSLSPAHDAEALRLIKEGPVWKPGTLNGAKIPQKVKVSVRFK